MVEKSGLLSIRSLALLLTIVGSASIIFAWYLRSDEVVQAPEELEDYLFWQARDLTSFTLVGANDTTLNLDTLKGKWSFIFFGYTHCPDVCPVTLAVLGMAFDLLEKDPTIFQDIQGIFISVDPQRDSPQSLKTYAANFNPGFLGVTGSTAQVDAITRQIGALYSLHTEQSSDDYLVSHNSAIFLIDPQGRVYARFPPPHDAREIADIFLKIRAFYHKQVEKRWPFT